MSSRCNYCINKSQCSECDKGWKDKFIPSEEVAHYFRKHYVGVRGIDKCTYDWESTDENLVPTHSMVIDTTRYCAYCGEKMFPIQHAIKNGNYDVTGWCCICQGARDEIEYEVKREKLAQKHAQEMREFDKSYQDKLKFCTEKLIDIQLKRIKENYEDRGYNYSHINVKEYHSVKQLMDL